MKVCYLDAFSGISGDMLVGAFVDAGADGQEMIETLSALNTGATFRVEKVKRNGIAGTKFHVDGTDSKKHRHLPHIVKMIEEATLPAEVQRQSVAVFEKLGEAEAAIHGVPIEKVHFHEVGAIDSICDIVGACLGLHLLGVERLACSAINVGSGTVKADHGVMPVPAPATAELLKGLLVYSAGPATELCTPTGAAVVAALGSEFGRMPAMRIDACGFGAGTKDFKEMANLLRVLVGEDGSIPEASRVRIVEANLDDTSPQVVGHAMERLFAEGALDVTVQPVAMKKNRPGVKLTVICRPEDWTRLSRVVFTETSTFGVRAYEADRLLQQRHWEEVETRFGKVRVKVGGPDSFAPEYEDCRALAVHAGVALKTVLAEAAAAFLAQRT
ncbi:MAG: nickel pincer cofactor biosynthesis protein LarC [Bryobacterales bacterium]|nr:nickel pincer cofactor biosynthesis protein LarC [Bryobacterales bacterium]